MSIYSPRKDQCDLCCSYKESHVSEEDYAFHIAMKNRAREEKVNDKKCTKENRSYVFCMDMQAVQLCPVLPASSLYYSMKLKVHNMAIYNLGNNECITYCWHEAEAELKASVFTTIRIKHLIKVCTQKLPIIIPMCVVTKTEIV